MIMPVKTQKGGLMLCKVIYARNNVHNPSLPHEQSKGYAILGSPGCDAETDYLLGWYSTKEQRDKVLEHMFEHYSKNGIKQVICYDEGNARHISYEYPWFYVMPQDGEDVT